MDYMEYCGDGFYRLPTKPTATSGASGVTGDTEFTEYSASGTCHETRLYKSDCRHSSKAASATTAAGAGAGATAATPSATPNATPGASETDILLSAKDVYAIAKMVHKVFYQLHPRLKDLVDYLKAMATILSLINVPIT